MVFKTVQIIVMFVTLHINAGTLAQRDVVIKVKPNEGSITPYSLVFNTSLFTQFHHNLSMGCESCTVKYHMPDWPDSIVQSVTASCMSQNDNNDQYYKCTIRQPRFSLECNRQEKAQLQDTYIQTYRIRNLFPLKCIGFVWTIPKEEIQFLSNHFENESCGNDCSCPGRTTTSQSETTTVTFSSSTIQTSTTTPTVSSVSLSPTPLTTIKKTSSTTIPTTFTTSEATGNADAEKSGDDAPIGIIVGAVVGVVVLAVIAIITVVIWRKRKARAKSTSNAGHGRASITSSSDAGVGGKRNDGKSHSYYNSEFSNNSELHAPKNRVVQINGYQNSLHQPNITENGVAPVTDPHKPQFAINDTESDLRYSTAQLVVPEDNNNINGKKPRDDYDCVYAEDDVGVSNPTPKTTRDKTPIVSPPKVRDDYAVVDKTRKNKTPSNMSTSKGLTSDYDDIPEEDYGYSHAEGDSSVQGTKEATVGKPHVAVSERNLPGPSDLHQDFGYEYSRTSDGYTTVGNVNQSDPDPNNDDPNATSVYSRLHEPVRDIQNPYNVGPNTNDVYSKLHEEVRDIKNPYNVLPEPQEASDSNNAFPDTTHNAQGAKDQKPPKKSLPYGKEDYAVVVKTKSNKPAQSTFELGKDEN